MGHNHGGLEDHVPFFSWVICRIHVNLPGCRKFNPASKKRPMVWGLVILTLPETNIAPENRPLEKEIPIGIHHLQGLCWFYGG